MKIWPFDRKFKLQGIKVTDANSPPGGRTVPVRFRLPQDDMASLSYPVIIIEHQGFFPAPEREHRGWIQLPYAPESYPIWWDPNVVDSGDVTKSPYYYWYPIPFNLDYKITVFTRQYLAHTLPIIQTLLSPGYIPYHFAHLEVPQDHSRRTIILQGGPYIEYGKDEDDKRIFTTTFLIRVFSELINMPPYPGITKGIVHDINLEFFVFGPPYTSTEPLSEAQLMESHGILSVGSPAINWNTGFPYENINSISTLSGSSAVSDSVVLEPAITMGGLGA